MAGTELKQEQNRIPQADGLKTGQRRSWRPQAEKLAAIQQSQEVLSGDTWGDCNLHYVTEARGRCSGAGSGFCWSSVVTGSCCYSGKKHCCSTEAQSIVVQRVQNLTGTQQGQVAAVVLGMGNAAVLAQRSPVVEESKSNAAQQAQDGAAAQQSLRAAVAWQWGQ